MEKYRIKNAWLQVFIYGEMKHNLVFKKSRISFLSFSIGDFYFGGHSLLYTKRCDILYCRYPVLNQLKGERIAIRILHYFTFYKPVKN